MQALLLRAITWRRRQRPGYGGREGEVEVKDQNSSGRGRGGRGLAEEGQGGFLEEVAFELGLVSWGKIAHR